MTRMWVRASSSRMPACILYLLACLVLLPILATGATITTTTTNAPATTTGTPNLKPSLSEPTTTTTNHDDTPSSNAWHRWSEVGIQRVQETRKQLRAFSTQYVVPPARVLQTWVYAAWCTCSVLASTAVSTVQPYVAPVHDAIKLVLEPLESAFNLHLRLVTTSLRGISPTMTMPHLPPLLECASCRGWIDSIVHRLFTAAPVDPPLSGDVILSTTPQTIPVRAVPRRKNFNNTNNNISNTSPFVTAIPLPTPRLQNATIQTAQAPVPVPVPLQSQSQSVHVEVPARLNETVLMQQVRLSEPVVVVMPSITLNDTVADEVEEVEVVEVVKAILQPEKMAISVETETQLTWFILLGGIMDPTGNVCTWTHDNHKEPGVFKTAPFDGRRIEVLRIQRGNMSTSSTAYVVAWFSASDALLPVAVARVDPTPLEHEWCWTCVESNTGVIWATLNRSTSKATIGSTLDIVGELKQLSFAQQGYLADMLMAWQTLIVHDELTQLPTTYLLDSPTPSETMSPQMASTTTTTLPESFWNMCINTRHPVVRATWCLVLSSLITLILPVITATIADTWTQWRTRGAHVRPPASLLVRKRRPAHSTVTTLAATTAVPHAIQSDEEGT